MINMHCQCQLFEVVDRLYSAGRVPLFLDKHQQHIAGFIVGQVDAYLFALHFGFQALDHPV